MGKKTYSRHDSGDEAAPSAEDGKEANDELDSREDDRNDKRPVHPARSLLVRIKTLLEILAKHLLRAGVLELPDGKGVEPEAKLARGAVVDGLLAVLVLCAGAVRP